MPTKPTKIPPPPSGWSRRNHTPRAGEIYICYDGPDETARWSGAAGFDAGKPLVGCGNPSAHGAKAYAYRTQSRKRKREVKPRALTSDHVKTVEWALKCLTDHLTQSHWIIVAHNGGVAALDSVRDDQRKVDDARVAVREAFIAQFKTP